MKRTETGFGMVAIGVILFLLVGGAFLYWYKIPVTVAEDEETQEFDYDDITEVPDDTDVTEDPTTEDLEEEDKLEETDDEVEPDPDEDEHIPDEDKTTPPPPPDHSFSGSVTAKVELIDMEGNPLSIVQQSFVRTYGGKEIDKLKLRYDWDIELGEDLDPLSFEIHLIAKLKYKWQDALNPVIDGEFDVGRISEAYSKDPVAWNTNTWDIEDQHLGLYLIEGKGEAIFIWTTKDSFTVEWTATVKTKGGIQKIIKGSFGISMYLYWTYDYDMTDPDLSAGDYSMPLPDLPYIPPDYWTDGYDPNIDYLSIVPI